MLFKERIDGKKIVKLLTMRLGIGLIFLPLFAIANMLQLIFTSENYVGFVNTFNHNLDLIILFSMFLFLFEFFRMLRFPYNLPYPFFTALAGLALTKFVFELAIILTATNLYFPMFMRFIEPLTYLFLFILVSVAGFVKILLDELKSTD